MALVAASIPFELTVSLGATNDKKLTKTYKLNAVDAAEAATNSADILTRLGNVSAGKVVGYKISHVFVEDNYTRPTSEDAEWGEEAVISGKILDEPFETWTARIPFPLITIFVSSAGKNRDVVDITDVAVIAYKGIFETGSLAYISDGEFAETLEEGRRIN